MQSEVLTRVNRLLRRSGMGANRLGRKALGDPRLVADLRAGRVLRPATEARLNSWLDAEEQALEERRCRAR